MKMTELPEACYTEALIESMTVNSSHLQKQVQDQLNSLKLIQMWAHWVALFFLTACTPWLWWCGSAGGRFLWQFVVISGISTDFGSVCWFRKSTEDVHFLCVSRGLYAEGVVVATCYYYHYTSLLYCFHLCRICIYNSRSFLTHLPYTHLFDQPCCIKVKNTLYVYVY